MATVLRLPHMDIVLAQCEAQDSEREVRRSDRIRNISQGSDQRQETGRTRGRQMRRRRYNSVMEDDGEDDGEVVEQKKREPEHRRLNRLRLMKQTENVR